MAKVIYILLLISTIIGITGIVGLIMAYVMKDGADDTLMTHYRFQIRTFWIGLLYTMIGALLLQFIIGFIILLGLVVSLLVRWWIDRPVQRLVTATRQVAGGNLSHTVEVDRKDELGILANSFNNMTEKLAEARLQLFQSDKLASLGRLAAGVAHEINNPLTAVLTYSSYLLKRSGNQPEIRKDLEVIVEETIRCREIVKSLLDFARQTVPKKRNANINEIIERARNVVENQLAIGRVELILDLDSRLLRRSGRVSDLRKRDPNRRGHERLLLDEEVARHGLRDGLVSVLRNHDVAWARKRSELQVSGRRGLPPADRRCTRAHRLGYDLPKASRMARLPTLQESCRADSLPTFFLVFPY